MVRAVSDGAQCAAAETPRRSPMSGKEKPRPSARKYGTKPIHMMVAWSFIGVAIAFSAAGLRLVQPHSYLEREEREA